MTHLWRVYCHISVKYNQNNLPWRQKFLRVENFAEQGFGFRRSKNWEFIGIYFRELIVKFHGVYFRDGQFETRERVIFLEQIFMTEPISFIFVELSFTIWGQSCEIKSGEISFTKISFRKIFVLEVYN